MGEGQESARVAYESMQLKILCKVASLIEYW